MELINLCHVQVLPILSGVQRSMLELFKHLDRTRFEPHVICKERGPLTEELEHCGIEYSLVPSLDRPIQPWRDWQAGRELQRICEERAFDVVHTHSSKSGVLGRFAARRAGVPCIVHHVRGFAFHEFSTSYERWLFSRIEKWAGRHCDWVIFVNDEERSLATHQCWLPEEKCTTIYNGVDLGEIEPGGENAADRQAFRIRHDAAKDEVIITVLGRMDPQKQPEIVPAIAGLLEKRRLQIPWRFLLVGDGPLKEHVEAMTRRLGVQQRVAFHGWENEPKWCYRGSDVVLHTALWEGLPRTLIEAQAAGLPIVASNVKGNREVVDEETGFLCKPKNPADYAQRLAQLIDSPELRARFGGNARRRAERLFDSRKNNRQIITVYEELLARAAAEGRLRSRPVLDKAA